MLVCSNCNHRQEDGKFCSVCGGPLVEQTQTTEQVQVNQNVTPSNDQVQNTTNAQQQPNQAVENVKKELSNYWGYFTDFLKNPTKALNTSEQNFLNGLITLVLYLVTFSLSMYFLINGLYKDVASIFGYYDESAPFFEVFFRVLFYIALLVLSGLVAAFIMLKVAKINFNINSLIAQFGSLSVPFVVVNLVAILTALAGAGELTVYLLLLPYSILVSFTPGVLVFEKATQVDVNGQRYYYAVGTVVITAVLTYFIVDFIVSDFLNKYFGGFGGLFF